MARLCRTVSCFPSAVQGREDTVLCVEDAGLPFRIDCHGFGAGLVDLIIYPGITKVFLELLVKDGLEVLVACVSLAKRLSLRLVDGRAAVKKCSILW